MKELFEFIRAGGPVMLALLTLSIVLYSRCCKLLLSLRRTRRRLDAGSPWGREQVPVLRRLRTEAQESFRQQRVALAAMVAAAPLLGLLGTVSGMMTTFESLSARADGRSMGDLARGISQVLVATESGLAVAIPALVTIYFVHGRVRRYVQRLDRLESAIQREALP
jgi:biopolymer transport protein ExbB